MHLGEEMTKREDTPKLYQTYGAWLGHFADRARKLKRTEIRAKQVEEISEVGVNLLREVYYFALAFSQDSIHLSLYRWSFWRMVGKTLTTLTRDRHPLQSDAYPPVGCRWRFSSSSAVYFQYHLLVLRERKTERVAECNKQKGIS